MGGWQLVTALLAVLIAAPTAEAQLRPTFARRADAQKAAVPNPVAAILTRSDLALTAEQSARLRGIAEGLARANAPLDDAVRRSPDRPPADALRRIRANNLAALAQALPVLTDAQRALLHTDATISGAPR